MHDAMTMPLKCVSPLPCNSMVSTALTPLSSRMGSAWPSRLQSRAGNVRPLLTTKRAHFGLGWWGSERALEGGENCVDLEGLADVLGAFRAKVVVGKTARAKQGATTHCQPLLTRKRAHFDLRWCGSKRAHECGEHHVALEGLANVLGAFRAKVVVGKTARAKQGATKNCQPHLTWGVGKASAHSSLVRTVLILRASPMCLALPGPIQLELRLQGPNKETTHCQPLLTTKRAHFGFGWWGSERAHERGKCLVDLEGFANVLSTLVANSVALKTARAKRGAAAHCQPLLTTKRAHFGIGYCEGQTRSNHSRQPLLTTKRAHFDLGWWGSGRALEGGECRVYLESLANVLGALCTEIVAFQTARAKQGGATNCQPLTTKQAHSELGWWGMENALQRGECLVDLDGLADVLGALPLLTTKRAHFDLGWCRNESALESGEHRVALEGLADVLGAFRADAFSKTASVKQGATTNCQPLLTRKRAHSDLGWWGSGRALERSESHVDLEGLADVLGAFLVDSVVAKTARAKQGAITAVLLKTKQAHSEMGWWGREGALEHGKRLVDLEALADVLGAFRADAVVNKTARPNKEHSRPSAPADKKASAF
eukprot:scaffold7407_cov131-Isochrysis_galbana.AAC.5